MTTPFDYFKQATDQALIDRHKAMNRPRGVIFKGGVRMERVCDSCGAKQPGTTRVNDPCWNCASHVVLWIPIEKE